MPLFGRADSTYCLEVLIKLGVWVGEWRVYVRRTGVRGWLPVSRVERRYRRVSLASRRRLIRLVANRIGRRTLMAHGWTFHSVDWEAL